MIRTAFVHFLYFFRTSTIHGAVCMSATLTTHPDTPVAHTRDAQTLYQPLSGLGARLKEFLLCQPAAAAGMKQYICLYVYIYWSQNRYEYSTKREQKGHKHGTKRGRKSTSYRAPCFLWTQQLQQMLCTMTPPLTGRYGQSVQQGMQTCTRTVEGY